MPILLPESFRGGCSFGAACFLTSGSLSRYHRAESLRANVERTPAIGYTGFLDLQMLTSWQWLEAGALFLIVFNALHCLILG
jgi:hypothetical protein